MGQAVVLCGLDGCADYNEDRSMQRCPFDYVQHTERFYYSQCQLLHNDLSAGAS